MQGFQLSLHNKNNDILNLTIFKIKFLLQFDNISHIWMSSSQIIYPLSKSNVMSLPTILLFIFLFNSKYFSYELKII